ncbi:MAG: hypothetical protein RQ751_04195 [Longimicrobiales bacterium]|nr:hypothetical protein [Longimicrobiales bacterium]
MNRFQRRLLWWSTLLTAATGGVYAWMKHLMEPVDEWAVINHPLQPWVLKLHILVAPVMVFAVGMVTVTHVWPLLKAGLPRGRWTGIGTAATFGPLVLTGYLVQVVTWPRPLAILAWNHLGLGILVTAAFLGHRAAVVRGLRRRKGALSVLPSAAPPPAPHPARGSPVPRPRARAAAE